MRVGGYQLCELLSASEVGTRYRATSRGSDDLVEIVLLRCDDAQAVSWHDTCKRWQTAALIESPAVRRIEALELDATVRRPGMAGGGNPVATPTKCFVA